MDSRGRIADQTIITALGWTPGTDLGIDDSGGRLIIHPNECAVITITKHGHLRLPATVRHRNGLRAGDRVLLAADPDQQTLTVYPPALLDVLLAGDPS